MIPLMDDPLGKYWDQPPGMIETPVDDTHALMQEHRFKRLHEYSSSIPSGVYPGKCWRRNHKGTWYLGWYGPETEDHQCPIMFRKVLLV